MSTTARFAVSSVVLTLALVVVLGVGALSVTTAFALYVLAMGAVSVIALVRVAGAATHDTPSLFEHALREQEEHDLRPGDLLRVERDLVIGTSNAGAADLRLLPMLRAAAAARLSARHGIDLERRPEAARGLLGDDAWELLRPDRPPFADRGGPGVPQKRIARVVDVLERL